MTFRLAVLAGGFSRRMGFDKATLRIEGEPVLVRLVERLGSPLGPPWVLCREDQHLTMPKDALIVHDSEPGEGPLAALMGLAQLTHDDPVLVVPCDMPELPRNLGDIMTHAQRTTGADAVVCVVRGRRESLPFLATPRAFAAMMRAVETGARRADAWHAAVHIHEVEAELTWGDASHRLFRNDNEPTDLGPESR